MKVNLRMSLSFLLLLTVAFSKPVLAQKFEISPYAGGIFPTEFADVGDFKDEGIYGVRGGSFLTNSLSLEGNFGYINHFEFEGTDPEMRAVLWEASGSYHFFPERTQIVPFATFGVGGLTLTLDDPNNSDTATFLADNGTITRIPSGSSSPTGQVFQLEDGNSFFTLTYGGGVKANRLWGPVGIRFDVRGRTLPNFLGRNNTWLETTGGITLAWGER